MILARRVLFGGLMAGNVGAAFAAAADLADDKTRARNMGLLGAAVGFGFIAGPALGAFLIGETPDARELRACLLRFRSAWRRSPRSPRLSCSARACRKNARTPRARRASTPLALCSRRARRCRASSP